MLVEDSLLSWDQLLKTARSQTTARRIRRPGQSPSTVPVAIAQPAPGESAPVLLYRDTNSWCPFCERVWFALEEKQIPFETEFIDLSNKPQWYLDLVPIALVPAAKIEGNLVYESKDILLALEARFGETLLPTDSQENAVARQWIEESETNGFLSTSYSFLRATAADENEQQTLQSAFEAKLDELEGKLGKYSGSYFLSSFGLVDILYSPYLDRLAANLPVYQKYSIKGNPRFPRLNQWFTAIGERPAYQRVKLDPITNNLLLRRRWGIEPIANLLPLDLAEAQVAHNRAEAAERLSDNREVAIADIFKNSGAQAFSNGNVDAVTTAIDLHLRLLANELLLADETPLPWGRIGGKDQADATEAAVGAIALAYVRNRICAPRDMSAGAATALRAAIDRVLTSLY